MTHKGRSRGISTLWLSALLVLLCTAVMTACAPAYTYHIPEQTGDSWQTAHIDEVNMNEEKLGQAVARIQHKTYKNVHSMLIVKDGKLVFEAYFSGHAWDYSDPQFQGQRVDFDVATTHNLASVTKSVTSALFGIAMDQGFIESVDQEVFTFFPDYAHLATGGKAALTLEHLLTMRSGLAWNESDLPYSDPNNDLVRLFAEDDPIAHDPIAYILAKPLAHEPGTTWYYNGGGTNLLGEVIREATGMRMDEFSAQHLFAPLGITHYEWDYINPDMVHASGNLRLRPRDMAKFGQLFLNGGTWQGERIVSQAWVAASTKEHVSLSETTGYGYQWWLKTYQATPTPVEAFHAAGWGGQRIIVFPSLDMVVVFTGGNYVGQDPADEIVERFILPAVE